jgi:pimeloyl-ACP methyl ester carboxylesterase
MSFIKKSVPVIAFLISLTGTVRAQTATHHKASQEEKKAYSLAKKDFAAFESKHGRYIQTRNVRMHYLTWGNPSNPALVWSHGSLLNAYELLPVADSLAKAGFYIIAIDYYGHGLTPIPKKEVSLYHVADDIKFLMDKLNIKKAFIGGFSRGGFISTAFYDAYPKSVLGLVLEDGGSVGSNVYYDNLSTEKLKERAKEFDVKGHNPWDITYNSEMDAFTSVYDKNDKRSQFENLAIIRKNMAGKWAFYPGLLALFHLSSSQEFLDLTLRPTKVPLFAESMVIMEPKIIFRNLNIPVLIMDPYGKGDENPVELENQALQKEHPKFITYIGYPDSGHNILYEQPKKFTKDVIGFLKRSLK